MERGDTLQIHNQGEITMTKKRITEMNIGDEFLVEYGDYDNWTTAKIVDIRPTEYEHIKEVDYTIPRYCGEEIHTHRMINVEVRG